MALDEQGVLLRVQPAGDVLGKLLQRPAAQIRRVLANGDGVQVRHEIEALIGIRTGAPVADGSQIVAKMQIAGGLNAGKHPLLRDSSFGNDFAHCLHIPSLVIVPVILSQNIPFRKGLIWEMKRYGRIDFPVCLWYNTENFMEEEVSYYGLSGTG